MLDWFQVQGKFISSEDFCKIKIKEMILRKESKVTLTKSNVPLSASSVGIVFAASVLFGLVHF